MYCDHSFHGLTTGALALNGADFFRERFGELMPGTIKIPFNDLPALEKALAGKDIAAFILEPVQGKSCEVVADGYLAEAQRLCNKAGTLLVWAARESGLRISILRAWSRILFARPRRFRAGTCRWGR